MNFFFRPYFTGIVILLLFISVITHAGELDNFEDEATKQKKTSDPSPEVKTSPEKRSDTYHGDYFSLEEKDCDCDSIFECIFCYLGETIVKGLYHGGKISFDQRRFNETLIGTPVLPTAQLDSDYQYVDADIYAANNRLEFGYGPFGFQYRESRYFESHPNDKLKMYQFNYLHRMTDGRYLRVDLGAGKVFIKGDNKNSGFSMVLPVYIFLPGNFTLFLRNNWGWINSNSIRDYKLGVLYSRKYISLQLGYHSVKSGDETLDGPFSGISLHF